MTLISCFLFVKALVIASDLLGQSMMISPPRDPRRYSVCGAPSAIDGIRSQVAGIECGNLQGGSSSANHQ